ncbi:hypothetical protein W04_2639 [Pseudoalteromonas sp. SW0106-04]|uniref:hypothetical protein n=1 Tax=Pseudoalteromonas sp. SW0106-04 TaxID=1702169 RepID=UPI0006B5A7AE|nr:hypothetical protein [Pseudoalteromonas sp. SW0106-04]GAP76092.1 hypothetical protein W04_2639 [Pseudoalteromonas sp. SW0106-04]
MDKVERIRDDIASLQDAIVNDSLSNALELQQRIDEQLRSLNANEVSANESELAAMFDQLGSIMAQAESKRTNVKRDLSNFTANQSKLRAYDIPR